MRVRSDSRRRADPPSRARPSADRARRPAGRASRPIMVSCFSSSSRCLSNTDMSFSDFLGGCAGRISTRLGRLRAGCAIRSTITSATSSGISAHSDLVFDEPAEAGIDRSWQDIRHADAVVANLLHQRLAEGVQRRLRRTVGGAVDEGVLAGQAADVDDPAAAARLEVRQRGVAAVEDAAQVRVDDAVPLIHRHLGHRSEHADASVVDRMSSPPNVDTVCANAASTSAVLAHVGPDAERVRTQRREPRHLRGPDPLPVIATDAPLATSALAVASPIPREPPVTNATFQSVSS